MEFIEILPDQDFGIFHQVRKDLYPSPPTEDNPATEHLNACYVLIDKGMAIGRFAIYHNPQLIYQDKKTVCIGNYESINDNCCARTLIDKAIAVAKEMGAEIIIGPMNGSTCENYRFADESYPDSFLLEPYNHPWYNSQFIESGFYKIGRYFTAIDKDLNFKRKGVTRIENELRERGYCFRNLNITDYENELANIYDLSILAFNRAFLFTDFSPESFKEKYLPLRNMIDPEFVILSENSDGILCGFIFCVKDIKQPLLYRLIIKTIARKPGKEYAGIGEILGKMIYERALENGYKSIIHALMFDSGSSVPHSLHRTGHIYNTYSLYAMKL